MIVVAGEALFDILVGPDGRLTAVPGGGPFNTARTIGRLGGAVAYLGRLSVDRFGRILASSLEQDGVDLRWTTLTEAPTTLAVAELDTAGAATYRFHLAETSAPGLELDQALAAVRVPPTALHIGTLGLVGEPIASTLAAVVARTTPATLVMVDPNCRPRAIVDRDAYLQRLDGIIDRADVVKVSADDLAYLAPGVSALDAARGLVGRARRIILVTDGGRPVTVVTPDFDFAVVVPQVEIVDTVGSGDAFGGAFIARWIELGRGRAELTDPDAVREAVERAIGVAAITASRAGADPPKRAEVGWPAA